MCDTNERTNERTNNNNNNSSSSGEKKKSNLFHFINVFCVEIIVIVIREENKDKRKFDLGNPVYGLSFIRIATVLRQKA